MVRHAEPSGEQGDPSRHRRRAPATGPRRRCRRRSFHGARLKLETGFVSSLWGNSFLDHEGIIREAIQIQSPSLRLIAPVKRFYALKVPDQNITFSVNCT